TSYSIQMAAFTTDASGNRIYGPRSNIIHATTTQVERPVRIGQIRYTVVGRRTSVFIVFDEGHDGTGKPARYAVRISPSPIDWGSTPSVTQGSCSTPLQGVQIDRELGCSIEGLTPNTTYQVQLVTYRGTLNQDAVFSELSSIATFTTAP